MVKRLRTASFFVWFWGLGAGWEEAGRALLAASPVRVRFPRVGDRTFPILTLAIRVDPALHSIVRPVESYDIAQANRDKNGQFVTWDNGATWWRILYIKGGTYTNKIRKFFSETQGLIAEMENGRTPIFRFNNLNYAWSSHEKVMQCQSVYVDGQPWITPMELDVIGFMDQLGPNYHMEAFEASHTLEEFLRLGESYETAAGASATTASTHASGSSAGDGQGEEEGGRGGHRVLCQGSVRGPLIAGGLRDHGAAQRFDGADLCGGFRGLGRAGLCAARGADADRVGGVGQGRGGWGTCRAGGAINGAFGAPSGGDGGGCAAQGPRRAGLVGIGRRGEVSESGALRGQSVAGLEKPRAFSHV